MTHDELLIHLMVLKPEETVETRAVKLNNAIRAVVELHKPSGGWFCDACANPNDEVIYPCPTIQAIEKELG